MTNARAVGSCTRVQGSGCLFGPAIFLANPSTKRAESQIRMIKSITFGNVRLFEGDSWHLPFSPLTVLCGTNSSGKSTIIKLPMILAQSNRAQQEGTAFTDGQLRLRSAHIDMGTYGSLVSGNQEDRSITISIAAQLSMASEAIREIESFSEIAKRTRSEATGATEELFENLSDESESDSQENSQFVEAVLQAKFEFASQAAGKAATELERSDGAILVNESRAVERGEQRKVGVLRRANFVLQYEEREILQWSVEAKVTQSHTRRMGRSLYVLRVSSDVSIGTGLSKYCEPNKGDQSDLDEYLVYLRGLLPAGVFGQDPRRDDTSSDDHFFVFPLPPALNHILLRFSFVLESIHYLAPLRSPPKRYYLTDLESAPGLDPAGEFLGYFLRDIERAGAWSVDPPGSGEASNVPLLAALQQWLLYLRDGKTSSPGSMDREVEIKSIQNIILEFRLRSLEGAGFHALADSGFGYSQVIPVLIRCLSAEVGDTVLIEQPELHLHPAIQIRLAQFFLAMVRANKQIVIETHSEHLVNALRVLSAENLEAKEVTDIKVFFLDAEAGKAPKIHDLTVCRDGTVPDWPRSFFGESLSLSTRLLAAQSRRFKAAQTKSND